MRRVLGIGLLVVALPFLSYAQTLAELEAQLDRILQQISALTSAPSAPSSAAIGHCPNLARTLSRGMAGADVSQLQDFLRANGHLNFESTGFFGPLTETALQAYQAKAGIVSSGSPTATGWGSAGPRTRAAIAGSCGTASAPAQTQPSTSGCAAAPALPTTACSGVWQRLTDSRACHVGWACAIATPAANKPPVVNGVDGPVSLFIGESATWTIRATDPEGGALDYGVIWHDEGAGSILEILAGLINQSFTPSATISHTYISAGTYTPEITVRDSAGNTTSGTFSVRINARQSSTSPISIFGDGGGGVGSCTFGGVGYAEGTETEGYNRNDLCLATGGVCLARDSYVAKFSCTMGLWEPVLVNPYPTYPTYAGMAGAACSTNDATMQVVVTPGSQLCRGLLCAVAQNYALSSLKCAYVNWVDWGVFGAGATTTTVCAEPAPCEYTFGQGGRACAPKENGVCKAAPYENHPLNN